MMINWDLILSKTLSNSDIHIFSLLVSAFLFYCILEIVVIKNHEELEIFSFGNFLSINSIVFLASFLVAFAFSLSRYGFAYIIPMIIILLGLYKIKKSIYETFIER